MKKSLMEIIMNPTRQRIVQYLIVHEQGSTGEMLKELKDIPPASLYRHVRMLLDAGLIMVEKEERIRGAVEKTYRIVRNPDNEMKNQDIGAMIQTGLISLMTAFQKYFALDGNDPIKDMLSFSTSTIMMTDEEFMDFLMKLGAVINEAIKNKPEKIQRLQLNQQPDLPEHWQPPP